jgi:hypothetical protein
MQLTKLRAAPVLRAEVPPCAPAGETDGVTASQLIRSVGPTRRGREGGEGVPGEVRWSQEIVLEKRTWARGGSELSFRGLRGFEWASE